MSNGFLSQVLIQTRPRLSEFRAKPGRSVASDKKPGIVSPSGDEVVADR